MRIMLDHGKEQCKDMINNIRCAADKCGVLVPIILEQRSKFIDHIMLLIDKKRILAKVFNSPITAHKGTEVVIYTHEQVEFAQKELNALTINANSFTELNIKEGFSYLY